MIPAVPSKKSLRPTKVLAAALALAIVVGSGILFYKNDAEFFSADITGNSVTLEKTLLTMPGHGFFTNNATPLVAPFYGNGKFVIVGMCVAQTSRRGQFLFSEDGTALGENDVCKDSGGPDAAQHTWSAGARVQFDGARGFVRDMAPYRPATYYRFEGNTTRFAAKAYSADTSEAAPIDAFAVANGYAVAARTAIGKNVIYKLPEWQVVREWPLEFTPLAGIGNLVIGYNRGGANSGTLLYRIGADGQLTAVKTLIPKSAALGFAHDFSTSTSAPTKITLFVPRQNVGGGEILPAQDSFYSYEIRGDDLALLNSRLAPTGSIPGGSGLITFGVNGDYLAVATTGRTTSLANQAQTAVPTWELWKGNQKLATVELPNSRAVDGTEYIGEGIRGLAFAPSGRVLVTNYYGAYLYKIQNFSNSGTSMGNATAPTGQTQTGNNNTQSGTSSSTAPAANQCTAVGGLGCSSLVDPGEIQFGARGANGCNESYCVACAQGFRWNGNNCEQTLACTDASVGGAGCTFSIRFGEIPLGNPGAFGCRNAEPHCVQCAQGFSWDAVARNCRETPATP